MPSNKGTSTESCLVSEYVKFPTDVFFKFKFDGNYLTPDFHTAL